MMKELSDKIHDMKKKVHRLTNIEKGKIYGGDKTIMYEKLGLVEEEDVEKYRGKIGLNKDIDLMNMDLENINDLIEEEQHDKKKKNKRQTHWSPLKRAKKQFEVDEFKRILKDYHEEHEKLEAMTPLERDQYL